MKKFNVANNPKCNCTDKKACPYCNLEESIQESIMLRKIYRTFRKVNRGD